MRKELPALKHQSTRLGDGGQSALPFRATCIRDLAYAFERLAGTSNVDLNERIPWKEIRQIGRAVIDRTCSGQEAVGHFLGPVVGCDRVFDRQGEVVRRKPVPLVVDGSRRTPEQIHHSGGR